MPQVKINVDGSLIAMRNQAEIISHYDELINKRMSAMLKLMALGADISTLQERITQLNQEKKQKLAGG